MYTYINMKNIIHITKIYIHTDIGRYVYIHLHTSAEGRMGVSPPQLLSGGTSQKKNKCVGGCGV